MDPGAAGSALLKAVPLSRSHEHGGVILGSEGRYYFTEPVTNGRTGEIADGEVLASGVPLR